MSAVLKNLMLPIAMLTGIVGYRFIIELNFIIPYLIFVMLFLAFTKINFSELKPRPQHILLLVIQAVGAVAIYLLILLLGFEKSVAEAGMIIFIAPTATAAAVVTQRLGGNAASVTAYTLMSNLFVALIVPLFFPIIEPHEGISFINAFWIIMKKIFILLVFPFICAQMLRFVSSKLHDNIRKYSHVSFYMWGFSLMIVTAITCNAISASRASVFTQFSIAVFALLACIFQFYTGKRLGSRYNDRIACGQSLGQKNTILAIWMANSYLHPISALGPGCYVIWQNIVNSYQLWKKRNLGRQPVDLVINKKTDGQI